MELKIDCGFNSNDETINFGSRGIADNEPYESVTFASIQTKLNGSNTPSIISKLNGDQIFYSVDNFFGVFQDEEFGTLKFSCNSDQVFDDFFYCPTNKYLFLFLRDGSVQILKDISEQFIAIKKVQILEKKEPDCKKQFINIHFWELVQDKISLLIVTSDGLIFRLELTESEGSEISVTHKLICDVNGTIELSTYHNSMLFLSGSKLWVFNVLNNNLKSSDALNLKYADITGLMILSLLCSGELAYICPVTLLHFPREFEHPVTALSIIRNERDDIKYISAVSEKDCSGSNQLSLLRPDFSVVYTLKIANNIILINPESEIHEIRFISLIRTNGELKELRFQSVIETDPQKRLKRLLRRNLFDEAEEFARNQNLDVNIVTKEKAKLIAEKWKINRQDIDTLKNIFDSLNDHSFILDCCLLVVNGTCEIPDDFLNILNYACNLEVSKKDTTVKEKQYYCNRLLIRFKLFQLIGECNMQLWNSFSNESLIFEVKKLLKQQKLFQAITVYSHIAPTEIQNMDEKCIQEILDFLNGIDLNALDLFLPMFMSLTLEWLPSSVLIFMDWIEMKIFHLEKQHNKDFPENAINFLEISSEYLKINEQHSAQLQFEIKQIAEKVQTMSKILNKLDILKSLYGVRIAINDLKQDPKIVVRNLLNLDLTMDVYNAILSEFTYEYIIENELNPDEIFFDALIDILKYQESYWSNIISSILSSITSQDLKLRAVENMLTRAKLPWSVAVKQIGIQILKECYPKSGNVQELLAGESKMTVISRIEYRFEGSNYSNIDDLEFMVKRIIRCNLPTMISDAFVLCENKKSCEIDTMRLLLHHFIETGDFENVWKLLEKDETIVKKGLEFVLHDVDSLSELWTTSEARNYSHIFNSRRLIDKYSSLCRNEFESYDWRKKAYSFCMAYNVKTHFSMDISRTSISQLEEKKKTMNEIKNRIIDDYEKGTKNASEVLESLRDLSSFMDVSTEKLLSLCWKTVKVNKNEFLCKVAEEYLNNPVKIKYICILVVNIMENLCPEDESLLPDNSFLDSYSTEKSDTNMGTVLKLASRLITKAIQNANVEELSECLKVASWVDSIYFLDNYKEQNESAFEDSANINISNPSFLSLLAIQNVFKLYCSFIAQYGNSNTKYLSYYHRNENTMSQEVFLNEIKKIELSLHDLNREGESLLAYKLLTTLQTQLMTLEDLDIRIDETLTKIIKKHLVPNLVQQALLMAEINEDLLYTSLMWCDSQETEKFIVRTLQYNRKIPSKVNLISGIAINMFNFHKKNDLSTYFEQVILSVSWWERVKHLNIEYDLFFKVSSSERLKLMMKSEEFDVKLISEYCRDYNLNDVQLFYLYYLKTYLLNWKPRYEIESNNIGRRKLVMKENQQKELFHQCNDILHYIDSKDKAEKMLREIWSRINFYYYEVFACILDLYKDISYKHLKLMLQFLGTYERINKPMDMEVEKWFNTFPQCQVIEPLSEFRILFNNTLLESNNIWDIIRKEISLENYTKWFEAVQAFSFLNVDNICTFLAKELVAQGILKIIKPGDWRIPKHTHLFNEIENCLDYMKDDIKKITAAYLLLSNTPEGADQVTIAEIAYKFTGEYKMRQDRPIEISITKIEKEYRKCLSLQILHVYKLAEQCYIDLIANIEQLLVALYSDERIVRKMNNMCQYCPDINNASNKLAKIFNFDIVTFREKLVRNYLMDGNLADFGGDITIGYSQNLGFNERNEKERSENNLKRAAYICSDNINHWHNHLWNIEYNSDQSDYYKARCLKCITLFADEIAIAALSSTSYESIINILDQLTLSSILSKFGLQLDLNEMADWSIITKKLARIGSRDSVLALAQVCKILKIKTLKYWEYIIVNMDHFKLYSDLIEFLEYTQKEDYKYEKFYLEAWTNVITYTINDLLTLSDVEMDDRVSKELMIVQKCPVMFLLSLEDIIGKCIKLKKNRVVEILMQYIPEDEVSGMLSFLEALKFFGTGSYQQDVGNNYCLGISQSSVRCINKIIEEYQGN